MDGTITLQNLGVIAALSQNDKINTKDDHFTIYYPTTLRGFARCMYYGEGREHNVQKISKCIRDAKAYITTCMNEIVTDDVSESSTGTFMRKMSLNHKSQTCARMIASLQNSISGINSLKVTYKDDASCTSKLECLIHEIEDFLETTRALSTSSSGLARLT